MGSGKPLKREESKAGATAAWAQAGPSSSSPAAITVDGEDEDESLRHSDTLCREQVLRRRCRRLRQLHRIYRSQYWALLEELRAKHRGFYWEYGRGGKQEWGWGRSGFRVGGKRGYFCEEGREEAMCLQYLYGEGNAFYKLLSSAYLELSNAFHLCNKEWWTRWTNYMSETSHEICRAFFLYSHFQKTQKKYSNALRKAGLNISSTNKLPNFSYLISEFARKNQAKRREHKLSRPSTSRRT